VKKNYPRRVRESLKRFSVSKALQQRCEEMAVAAGFRKQLAGPYDFHVWLRELPDKRVITVNRPAALGLRHDESWIGHHGNPDQPYWSLGLALTGFGEELKFEQTRVSHELTLAEALQLAAQLESGEVVLDPHPDNIRH
jgi:hypothetical protein